MAGLAAGAPACAGSPAVRWTGVSSARHRAGVRRGRRGGETPAAGRAQPAGGMPPTARRAAGAATLMALLTDAEIDQQLTSLSGWTRADRTIRKQFTFEDFPEAVLFVSALVPAAEAADHHPDIEINYKRVTLTYSTHSE